MDTKELVSRAQNGDRKAIETLYHDSYQRAYTLAELVTQDEYFTRKMMIDAYRKAFASLDLIPDTEGFASWLNRFAVRQVDIYISGQADHLFYSEFVDDVLRDEPFQPVPDTDYSTSSLAALERLKGLPNGHRLLLLMHMLLDMPVGVIAETLAMEEDIVASLLTDSMRDTAGNLRKVIADVPPEQVLSFLRRALLQHAEKAAVPAMAQELQDAVLGAPRPKPAAPAQPTPQQAAPMQAPQPAKRHIGRNIAIILSSVILLAAGVLAFIVYALPAITGEQNALALMVVGEKVVNTPQQVVREFETAFNHNDRDGMAKCFLPSQSLERNLQGGGIRIINNLLDYFGSDGTLQISCELENLKTEGDTATGDLLVTTELPLFGKQTLTRPITFEKQEHKWYIKDIS